MTHLEDATDDQVIDQVIDQFGYSLQELRDKGFDKPVFTFTFNVSENDDVHEFPCRLACSIDNGV
jgi:hypothetical protein